jgi:hypothetical protein
MFSYLKLYVHQLEYIKPWHDCRAAKRAFPAYGVDLPYIDLQYSEQQSLKLNRSFKNIINSKFKFYSGDILYG